MQQTILVENYSYDHIVRGSWQARKCGDDIRLGDEVGAPGDDVVRLWLPAGTPMNWAHGTRPLRSHCLQFFWPSRWYMLSAFYDGPTLRHTYANIIRPAHIDGERITYVDLELSVLVQPNLSYEVLTQVEFEQAAEALHYDEETRISALMALRTLTSSIQLNVGIFAHVPYHLDLSAVQPTGCGYGA